MQVISNSVNQTMQLGIRLSRLLNKGSIICLFGEFGSGKTVLVKGIAKGLGVNPRCIISPSFVLMRQHKSKIPLNHFDFYRLKDLKQILDIGYEEFIYSGAISAIEWADRLKGYLPGEYLEIRLEVSGENKRLIKLKARGKLYRNLLRRLNEHTGN